MDRRIAIVGYSFRLPQTSKDTFWHDLLTEKDLVTEVPPGRWSFENHYHPDKSHPGSSYTFKAGSLGDISQFDADFFGISPREAAVIDPQQRYLLEMTWEAFEHAGIRPSVLRKTDTGVFIGISSIDYSYRMGDDLSCINASTATGNTSSIASNRISYTFDFQGPSISMDTACSSSMVAFHQACQAILSGDVTTAVTGGISLHIHPFGFIIFSKATMLSPDGRCKVFDASANGYVRSEGGGIFVLKDYDQAIADGDTIHAVVAGSAVNTDGYKSGITIPSCTAQQRLMEKAYLQANISPEDVDYIEAHGTGTPVGDPIETRAIGNALGKKRSRPLPIGSVKSNLGHLEPASGVAGLVKALLSIKHRMVPATISMKTPNPDIKFDEWNIRVVNKAMPLKEQGTITIGINSFGFGGANAHVVLQSDKLSTATPAKSSTSHAIPLVVGGKSEQAARDNAGALKAFLELSPSVSLYDTAWSCLRSRERFSDTFVLFCDDKEDAISKLQTLTEDSDHNIPNVFNTVGVSCQKGPVFVYSGNGCQWETMGKALLETSPVFRKAIENVDKVFSRFADFSLLKELKGENGTDRFKFTEIAQPSLFAVQVGVTEYLKSQGITPKAVTGHSVGEVAAAWASGALSLEDAVTVIYFRSMYQGKTKGFGAMTAAGLSSEEAQEMLRDPTYNLVHLAGVNSHRGVTLAGSAAQLDVLEQVLEERKVYNVRLPLDYAFHSPAMDTIEEGLTASLLEIQPRDCTLPYISTVTGRLHNGPDLNAHYWWNNIRQPVLFQQSLDYLMQDGYDCFVEVGSHPVLRSYLQDQARNNNVNAAIIPTLTKKAGDQRELEQSVAAAIAAEIADLSCFFPVAGQRIELPTYCWQHEGHWHPVTAESYKLLQRYAEHPLLGTPLPRRPLHWENEIDTALMPWLADHKVGDSVVFPGAGFIELALNAASHFCENAHVEIEGLEILAPLILEDGTSKVVQTFADQNSGDIEIHSRTYVTSEQWTLQCKARSMHQTTGIALDIQPPPLPTAEATFDAVLHTELAMRAGLHYGPAFSAVEQGWLIDSNEVIAQLNMPEMIEASVHEYFLHPGILDSAIQLVIHFLREELAASSGTAFIPSRVERVSIKRDATTQPSMVRVRLLKKAPHSLLTRFELFDSNGICIAVMDGVRFRAVRLYKSEAHKLSFLNYQLTPVGTGADNDTEVVLRSLNQAIEDALAKDFGAIERYGNEVAPLLESLIIHAVAEAFSELIPQDGTLETTEVEALNLRDECHQPFREHIIRFALDHEILSLQNDQYSLNPNVRDEEVTSNLIWNTLVREYPDYFTSINLAGQASLHLLRQFQGLEGYENSRDLVDSYQRLYRDLLTHTCTPIMASALKQVIVQAQERLQPGTRLRVLEVGASQTLLGHSICSQLDFGQSDYAFASYDSAAIESVTHLQERYPLAKSISIDLDEISNQASAESKQYHLVVITLDQPIAQVNLKLLEQVKPLFASGATVLLNGLSPVEWFDFAFGEYADWWHNGSSMQVSGAQWAKTLEDHLFSDVSVLSKDTLESAFYLISGRWEGNSAHSEKLASPEPSWLVLSTGSDLEEPVEQVISASGVSHTISHSHTTEQLAAEIQSAVLTNKPYTQVIFLSELGQNTDPLSSQTTRCELLTNITTALEQAKSNADIIVLTLGVGATLPNDQGYSFRTVDCTPADSATWGFTRTLMNESVGNTVRLIDLPVDISSASLSALIDELTSPSVEYELVIGHSGERFAPRLRTEDAPNTDKVRDANSCHISLGFSLPGQLRNLEWQSRPAPALSADDVEIEVKATGLNFRDIMYALGLLSDEAIENGFAGATMGLEFAGEVINVGSSVTDYKVGDAVVGFGSACFSNRMIATSYSIAHLPAEISYAAAATIPTTFLTVYYALHHLARLQPGEKVLVHGAAGGVGIAAIQVAQWIGAEVYATVGSQEKREFLQLLGVKHIYSSRDLTFAEEILRDTVDGRGVDVVLNSLAGEAINQNFRVLKPFGRFLELGKRDFYENTHVGLRPFRNNISYFGIDADQLQMEQTDLTKRLFREVLDLFRDGTFYPLPYTKFNAHQVVDAFRYMQQAKQIGKIVVTYEEGIQADTHVAPNTETPTLELDPQATYLVTGGLGGFGLRTAQWLTEKGARNLLLVSRRGATSEEATEFLAQCANSGINVSAEACDVTDKVALQKVIDLCGTVLPPLKGVVHAATLIDDSLIRNLDKQQIERSLAAKLVGAQYLDELTRELPLDLFVLYSSATTLFGNPGQAAYVAANRWLEALAATRQANNLPATCALWGAIDDAGFLARNEDIKDALQGRMGGNALSSEKGLKVLEQMILSEVPTLGIMELEWGALARFLPSSAQNKFIEIALCSNDTDHSSEDQLNLAAMKDEMSEEEFFATVLEILTQELSEILMIPADRIDPNKSIYDMGMDSLMGVELATALEARIGIQVPVMALTETPKLNQLTDKIISLITEEHSDAETNDAANAVQRAIAQHGESNNDIAADKIVEAISADQEKF
jgi:phthiocerol/phenolphthiocerol synthesis type-I polyketide synthase C